MSASAPPVPASEPETLIERRGRAGWILLNRPRALNALTLTMVREIANALNAFEADPEIAHVVVAGAGGRAFCAGGDIRKLHDQGKAGDHAAQLTFWREEYILNQRIKRYPKPFVAIIDGVVMGGGVGLSMHGAFRVASERCVFAMPEVGIGFFPDVGATYLLPRAPHKLGVFLALTGLRANGADMAALGFATSYTPSAGLPDLEAALSNDEGALASILARFAQAPPPAPLVAEAGWVEAAFERLEPDAIRRGVERAAEQGSAFAKQAAVALAQKSPTSQAIALRQMEIGSRLSFEEAMAVEYRIVSRICRGHDFYEGVRAVIIDKDNAPNWRPEPGKPVEPAAIDAYFAPLPESEELRFSGISP